MEKKYEVPILVDAAKLAAASRPERLGSTCCTGGSSSMIEE